MTVKTERNNSYRHAMGWKIKNKIPVIRLICADLNHLAIKISDGFLQVQTKACRSAQQIPSAFIKFFIILALVTWQLDVMHLHPENTFQTPTDYFPHKCWRFRHFIWIVSFKFFGRVLFPWNPPFVYNFIYAVVVRFSARCVFCKLSVRSDAGH